MVFRNVPQHLVVTGSAWIGRGVTALIQIFSIRLLLEGLGSEHYAVFVLLSSLIAWYMLADLGMGASLQNSMSEERAKGGDEATYLAFSALLAGALLILLVGLLFLLSPYLSAALLKSFNILNKDEKSQIFFISGILFLGYGIGNIGYKAWYAQHKGHLSNILAALASLIGYGLVWILMDQQMDSQNKLLWSVVAFNLPASLLSLISYIWQIANIPMASWRITQTMMRKFIRRSLKFWLLYAMATSVLGADYIILSQYLTAHEIIVYAISTRIFGFSAFFYTSLYAALWPHFTEAITKNDWVSVKVQLRKAFLFSVGIIVLVTIILLQFMPTIANVLSPKEKLAVPISFILLLGAYHLILVWVHGFAVVLQSMSDMRVLVVWTAIQALLSIIFQVIFVQMWGIYGITIGLIASYLLTAVWVVPSRVRHHFNLSQDKVS